MRGSVKGTGQIPPRPNKLSSWLVALFNLPKVSLIPDCCSRSPIPYCKSLRASASTPDGSLPNKSSMCVLIQINGPLIRLLISPANKAQRRRLISSSVGSPIPRVFDPTSTFTSAIILCILLDYWGGFISNTPGGVCPFTNPCL